VEQIFRRLGMEPKTSGNKVIAPAGAKPVERVEKVLRLLSSGGIEVRNVSMHEPTIDDVFLKLTGTAVRDQTGDYQGGRQGLMMRRGR
jgi:DUF438 domain-containing protein